MMSIEEVIAEVNATMAMEGMPLTDDDKNRIRRMGNNREEMERIISELVAKHTVRNIPQ